MRRWLVTGIAAAALVGLGFLLRPQIACALFLRDDASIQIAYTRDDGLYVMDERGGGQCRIAEGDILELSWSPDGRQIAYLVAVPGQAEPSLWLVAADGSGRRAATALTAAVYFDGPIWSPDGTQIIFVSQGLTASQDVVQVDIATGEGRALTNGLDALALGAAPDGSRLAFTAFQPDESSALYLMNADGSGLTLLTDRVDFMSVPQWSPDGGQFVTRTGGALTLWRADGSLGEEFTRPQEPEINLDIDSYAWLPDGERLAVIASRYRGDFLAEAPGVIAAGGGALSGLGTQACQCPGQALLLTRAGQGFLFYGRPVAADGSLLDGESYLFRADLAGGETTRLAPGEQPAVRPRQR